MEAKERAKYLSIILLCGIALHYTIITIVLNDNILLKFWKEIVIMIMLADVLIEKLYDKNEGRLKLQNINIKNIEFKASSIFIILFLVCLAIACLFTKKITACVYVIRLYMIPLLVYFIAKNNVNFNNRTVDKILKYVMVFYSIVCLWGIFQAFVLGDDFLINLGYPLKYEGRLRDSYYFGGFGDMQRVVSTFANTNVFGAVIGMLTAILILNKDIFENDNIRKTILFIFATTIVLTFSRSNWIALTCVLLLISIKDRNVLKSVGIILIILVGLAIVYSIFGDINILEIVKDYIYKTVTMEDTSAAGRFGIWIDAFSVFIKNPFGIGLGNVGTVAQKISGDILIHGESSYLAVLLDVGIQGAICLFGFIIYNLIRLFKMKAYNMEMNNFMQSVKCVIVYILIMFIFSNHIYDLEVTILSFFFIGLSNNKIFIESFKNTSKKIDSN